ncbi:MAG: S41 family peptidase [Candidatus Pedobacter colombiensis]|uniref:S41 family peptidase n=1 Tax=Candidatus Pedobacter colombiensis TaxID=3121371 RepID=A0AAJ5W695_9SPHI|nr:S41 family peptidase [Pedobacter sp.]WEK17759.1 MAG: S41 family peptidase [Pedobacter sp.]
MKTYLTLCFLFYSLLSCAQKPIYNIDAEELNPVTKMPKGWSFSFNDKQKLAYAVKIDSAVKQSGKYSISILKSGNQSEFGVIDYVIDKTFIGKSIELKGYIKTEQVDSGYAGLWMRIDGKDGVVAFDNMAKEMKNLKGTKDWKAYSITLPYDSEAAKEIHIGGLLVGKGKAWFDSFQLFIDGKAISEVPIKQMVLSKADLDTAFSKSSGIMPFKITPQIMNNLTLAGQFWGFLKYHHPSIAKGDYNWDAELFRFLPQAIKAKDNTELSKALEAYLDKLTIPLPNKEKPYTDNKIIAIKPDYGQLFDSSVFSKSLTEKLLSVRNCTRTSTHYYVSFMGVVGNPEFKNEKSYVKMAYPDAGYRILSLYRYWAMINYFFPYKDIIGTNWNNELKASIPDFVEAKDTQAYVLATLKIIAKINDTHANIWSYNESLSQFKGKYKLPFKADFIENKLVVTGYYGDTLNVKQKFLIGDIISNINGKSVDQLIKEFLPYTPASNYDTQLRDLPERFLLRGNTDVFTVELNRMGKKLIEKSNGLDIAYYPKFNPLSETKAFKLLNNEIGYIYPGKYKNSDLPAIKELFKNTKGMIIDMRCYPSDFMPFTFGNYIKSLSSPFVKFTKGELSQPGRFTYTEPLNNGALTGGIYSGKVVVIVNSTSQSQAEYTTMAFQSAPYVKVIGSTTAGADGNVSRIVLPGGISTMISGIGVFYPDGRPTQRVGVKIDYVLKPTIKGIIEGRDELLEKAKEMLGDLSK